MESYPYWSKQTTDKPLFPDIEWSKPEQRNRAGHLGIIGGNKLSFVSVAEAYITAQKSAVGETRVLLPDALRQLIPATISGTVFAASTPAGSLARQALADMRALAKWADGILLIGDASKSSETTIVYEDFARSYNGPLIITRDAVDLLKNASQILVERSETLLVVSFAQLQKLFRGIYYPKILTFSMQLTRLVEALHKFTITYPITIAVFHEGTLLVANSGKVATSPWSNAMAIWRGQTATKAAVYWLWNPSKPLESVTASLLY
jgi:NAD(P)H-hydrate repair Nnr-like enzyme with NAD(P)H-hydrate dehydratase domain